MDQFSNDGLTFDVTDTGPADRDTADRDTADRGTSNRGTVVLLHGFPQTSRSWRAVTPLLNEAGYRTVAPDQRGYSPGARPKGRFAYRMSLLVDDVAALIDAIGDGPVHVVGHDWGAAVAWNLAAARPQLVRTLTSVSVPHPGAFVKSMLRSDQALKSWYMAAFQPPLLPEQLITRFPGLTDRALRATGMDDDQLADVHALIAGGALSGGLNWYRAMMVGAPEDFARRVAVPTTHVYGARDSALSRRGAELNTDFVIGDYRLEVLEDADHWIPEHNADQLAAIIGERAASA